MSKRRARRDARYLAELLERRVMLCADLSAHLPSGSNALVAAIPDEWALGAKDVLYVR